MSNLVTKTIQAPEGADMALALGKSDELIRDVQARFDSRITARGNAVTIEGDAVEVESIALLFNELFALTATGSIPTLADVERMCSLVRSPEMAPQALRDDVIWAHRGRVIRPKTAGQKRLVDSIRGNSITFGLGPAGTGKTYLTCAMAVAELEAKRISRIVLTRPIVEAGESLGFLPGTMMEKVDPYIRPLYDALFDMMDSAKATRLIDEGTIEITPLAFMRGRTFNDCFVILDEAQNTTSEQVKMFLTRLGFGSKMVITGDESQSDSPNGPVGLTRARELLEGIDDISFVQLSGADVVRNSLVAKIVAAYEQGGRR